MRRSTAALLVAALNLTPFLFGCGGGLPTLPWPSYSDGSTLPVPDPDPEPDPDPPAVELPRPTDLRVERIQGGVKLTWKQAGITSTNFGQFRIYLNGALVLRSFAYQAQTVQCTACDGAWTMTFVDSSGRESAHTEPALLGAPPTNPPPPPGGDTTVMWDAPSVLEDGKPLTDLASYRVYRNGVLAKTVTETTATLPRAAGDTLEVTAVRRTGAESMRSDPLTD